MWSPAVTAAPPAAEPVTLEAAKEFLRLEADDTTFDAELTAYAAGIRSDVESVTGTRLITQTVELSADSFADLLRLPIGPVQSITGFTYLDAAGDEQVLTVDVDFELFGTGLDKGLRPVTGSTWPAGAVRASAIMVTAVVGYGEEGADLPQSVYLAMLRAVKGLFEDKPLPYEHLLHNHRIWA